MVFYHVFIHSPQLYNGSYFDIFNHATPDLSYYLDLRPIKRDRLAMMIH